MLACRAAVTVGNSEMMLERLQCNRVGNGCNIDMPFSFKRRIVSVYLTMVSCVLLSGVGCRLLA